MSLQKIMFSLMLGIVMVQEVQAAFNQRYGPPQYVPFPQSHPWLPNQPTPNLAW